MMLPISSGLSAVWDDPSWIYTTIQLAVLIVFCIALYRASRLNTNRVVELLAAVAFGLLLEEGDILIFKTYRYDPHWLAIDLVPVAVALAWSLIIASSMNFSDALGIDERYAPIADAVWVIILDLGLDAVAIRLGFWKWNIALDAGWFGVPYGNFYAWLWVAASFSFFTRWVRRRVAARGKRQSLWQAVVPLVSYGGLLAAVFPYAFLQFLYFRKVGSDWVLFAITFAVFCVLTIRMIALPRNPREASDRFLAAVRYLIHLYFLWALFATGISLQLPVLLYVSLTMLGVETALVVYTSCATIRQAIALE